MQDLQPDVKHAIVTTGQLIPTLAKLLICGLDAHVPADAIYSARNESKEHCFRLIEAAYGEAARYCVIGVPHGICKETMRCLPIYMHRRVGKASHHRTLGKRLL